MAEIRRIRRSIMEWAPPETEGEHPVCRLVVAELQAEVRRARLALHVILEGTDNPRRVAAEALERRDHVS
jgi:hypothetical protein